MNVNSSENESSVLTKTKQSLNLNLLIKFLRKMTT